MNKLVTVSERLLEGIPKRVPEMTGEQGAPIARWYSTAGSWHAVVWATHTYIIEGYECDQPVPPV